MEEFTELALMFVLNFGTTFAIVRYAYYPSRRNRDYVFTFFAFSAVTFLISSLFTSTDLSVGFGFGLFAIFSILRYRTDPIPIREMTYLFVIMALPVVNAVLIDQGGWAFLLTANLTVFVVLYLLEKGWGFQYETGKSVTYEKINLIRPENRSLLLADLCQRTGLPIKRCEVGRIDFLRDTAEITIYCSETQERVATELQGIVTSDLEDQVSPHLADVTQAAVRIESGNAELYEVGLPPRSGNRSGAYRKEG